MGEDSPPGRVCQRGEGAVQHLRRIFNHLVNYLAERSGTCKQFFSARPGLQKPVDCARRCDNRPGRDRQQNAEEQRFDGKRPMILAREKISGQFAE